MPNWCANELKLRHDDPTMIERARVAFDERALLTEFIPCPQELRDTVAGSLGRHDPSSNHAADLNEIKEQLNEKYFGYKNWYDWSVGTWGTKWDVGREDEYSPAAKIVDGEMVVSFNSAWSPPTGAYSLLEELGFDVSAQYYEPGVGFIGDYSDGIDNCYQIEGCPKYLADLFAIEEEEQE